MRLPDESADGPQRCPHCGKAEPGVTFDADTFSDRCDECVGFGGALSGAYAEMDRRKKAGTW